MVRSRRKPVVAVALVALLVSAVVACLPDPGTTGDVSGAFADMYDAQTMILPGWTGTELPTSQGVAPTTASGTSAMALAGPGGAVESFQIRMTGGPQALPQTTINQNVSFTATDGSNVTIPDRFVRVYREGYYHLTTMSDGELATEFGRNATSGACQASGTTGTQGINGGCRIPDSLIPACRVSTRPCPTASTTKAFPVDIPANENRVAWVDVQIPAGQHPGIYEANFEVRSSAVLAWNLNVHLDVKNVSIPATPTMTSQFRVNVNEIGLDWGAFQQMSELGLNDRAQILLEDMGDWQTAKTALKALIEGTDPAVTLTDATVPVGAVGPHARLTTLLVDHNVPGPTLAALRTWLQNLDGHDYSGMVKFYCDEIPAGDCQSQYATALLSYPGLALEAIPNPIAAQPLNTVPATTQTIVPEADDYHNRPGAMDLFLNSYQAWATGGKQLFTYTGCEQGGCDPDVASFGDSNPYHVNSQFTGIPGFGIDQPSSEVLAIGWLGYYHGISGQLYWNASKQYMTSWSVCADSTDTTTCGPPTGSGTSWMNPGGGGKGLNGDGNLFYRYTGKNADGSTSTFPIGSIRLKRFRDGQQDNDLLKVVANSSPANKTAADELVQCLFGAGGSCTASPHVGGTPMFNNTDQSPRQMAAARDGLHALVESAYPTGRP